MERGRFLKKHSSEGCWTTISPEHARVKVAHALQYHRRRPSLTSSSRSKNDSSSVDSQGIPAQEKSDDGEKGEDNIFDRKSLCNLDISKFDLHAKSPLVFMKNSKDFVLSDWLDNGNDELFDLFSDEVFSQIDSDEYLKTGDCGPCRNSSPSTSTYKWAHNAN